MIAFMRIYTKGGDKGQTSLFGGHRVAKSEPRLEAYGSLDELNSAIGVVRATLAEKLSLYAPLDTLLLKIQTYLFTLGSHLALGDPRKTKELPALEPDQTLQLESEIDKMEATLKPLTNFILPGGSMASSQLHLARTICRRAERAVVRLSGDVDPEVVIYLNRLSDFLFVSARFANHLEDVKDVLWERT